MSGIEGLPERVSVYEVGPRDGLQNESEPVGTADKVKFVNLLSRSGLSAIEVTSFVRPDAIPQLADAETVLSSIERLPSVTYTALVPNTRGMERAMESALDGIAVFTATSETFSRANTNASIAETLDRFVPVIARAREAGLRVRGYVSTAFGCPFEGDVPIGAVLDVSVALAKLGVDDIVISDTIGVATPGQVQSVIRAVSAVVNSARLALHFHDTRGTALANVLAGLMNGIATYDSSAGGLGGCPYAPGASGNLATEDLLYMLHGLGIETGVSLPRVVEASRFLQAVTGRAPSSRYLATAGA